MKWFSKSLVMMVGMILIFSTVVFAKSENAKESFVALGDSIPYGYNLDQTNDEPSKEAFPYIIGNEADLRVRDLAVPGWRTNQLLSGLKEDQKFRQAISHSDYVSLTIGSNDLLQALREAQIESQGNQALFFQLFQQKVGAANLFVNVAETVKEVRTLTDAPIVIYNVFNPFQGDDPLQSLGFLLLNGINPQIQALTTQLNSNYGQVFLADAYAAFGTNQATYVIRGDIHPTIEGQKKLAEIGLQAFGLK